MAVRKRVRTTVIHTQNLRILGEVLTRGWGKKLKLRVSPKVLGTAEFENRH